MLIRIITFTCFILALCALQAFPAYEFEKSLSKADLKWIENLIEKNPGLINTRFRAGDSLLHMTIRYCPHDNVEEIADYIISRGADVNAQNNDGTQKDCSRQS
jgi:ankyrin repeat protein